MRTLGALIVAVALAAGWGAAALLGPAALLTGAVLLPERWTGLAAQRH